ncbi:MAG: TIGR02466 family protein [Steroidobacteraceae bacterium]
MAAPPLKLNARADRRRWVELQAQAGSLVLFESWLRHQVPPNPAASPRISISFNYNWF